VRLFAPRAHEKGLELACHILPGVPDAIVGDPGRLRQVLVNLVGNAVKFTERGTVRVVVRIAAPGELPDVADGAECVAVVFEVHDTGPGLDDAQQAALFRPYARADAPHSDAHGGAGLGLAIAASLVRRMGGAIGVRGALGTGCTFWFAVPAWPDAARHAERHVEREATHAGDVGAAPRVLLVDDDPVGRRASTRLLERLGCRVDAVESIAAARDALAAGAHDAALLDCNLPDGDGVALVDACRANGCRHVVALTASAEPATRRRCIEAGMDACCVKPVGLDDLRDALALPPPPPRAERRVSRVPGPAVAALDATRLETLARLDADAPGLLAGIAADYGRLAPVRVASVRAALASGDRDAARREAHALRGASAAAGAARAARLAGEIERRVAEGEGDANAGAAEPTLAALEEAVAAAARELQVAAATAAASSASRAHGGVASTP
jgi:CheY-like chemotaxis protein